MNRQKDGSKMAVDGQNNGVMDVDASVKHPAVIGEKKGIAIYSYNPSVPRPDSISRTKKKVRVGDERQGIIFNDETGEKLSFGGAAFYEFEEVDNARFVKMYLAGVKQATELSKSGLNAFEIVYREMQSRPGKDEVHLSYYLALKYFPDMSERTYHRGMREILEKGFIFKSPFEGMFYVNIRFMFNGDRLAFVKGYKRVEPEPAQDALDFQGEDEEVGA